MIALSLRLKVPYSVLMQEDQSTLETYFDLLEEERKEAEKNKPKRK